MDRRILRSGSCNGGSKHQSPPSPAAGSRAAAAAGACAKEDAASGERKSLLPRYPGGGVGMARKSQRGSKRRVQWKDSHGKKLVEVLEFQPRTMLDIVVQATGQVDAWAFF